MKHSIKTYKFKLKLTQKQKELVDEYINIARCIYNVSLETRLYAYSSRKVYWNYYDLSSQLTELRKEFEWIRKLPSNACQDVLERQEKAFKSFFKGISGFPKFAKKDKYNSVTFKNLKRDSHNRLKVEKLGSIKYFNSREMEGKIQRATIIRKNEKYFISVTVRTDSPVPIQINHNSSKIGLDLGVVFYATDSNGKHYYNPKTLENHQKQLRIEQRSLARKKKGSNNRKKQKLKVSKLYEKIANTRKDLQHKLSTEIVNQYDIIIVEDLKPSKMLNNKYLNKQISDTSWSSFLIMLEYKCKAKGKIFEKINPAYTSQTCNECGTIDKKSRISQSEFVCTSCGFMSNADKNAAKNILGKGITNLRKRKALA